MRMQSCGKVVVIGSIGGLMAAFVPYYSASKFALDGLIEALRGEVAPFGIQVTIVHPGDLNTPFGANRILSQLAQRRPPGSFPGYTAVLRCPGEQAASPQTLARKVEKLLSKRSLAARVIVGTPLEKLGCLVSDTCQVAASNTFCERLMRPNKITSARRRTDADVLSPRDCRTLPRHNAPHRRLARQGVCTRHVVTKC